MIINEESILKKKKSIQTLCRVSSNLNTYSVFIRMKISFILLNLLPNIIDSLRFNNEIQFFILISER